MRVPDISELYASERLRLERQVRWRVGCAATARDIVQDVFLRFIERKDPGPGNAQAFLARAARNAAIDHIRAERIRREHAQAAPPDEASEGSGFEVTAAREDLQRVRGAMSDLPDRTRDMFLMNRVHGLSFREIAQRYGISERAVAKHMARALAACASAVDDFEP